MQTQSSQPACHPLFSHHKQRVSVPTLFQANKKKTRNQYLKKTKIAKLTWIYRSIPKVKGSVELKLNAHTRLIAFNACQKKMIE